MKKAWVISVVFLCMFAVSLGSAGTSLAQSVSETQDFEGGVPPAGWSVVNNLPGNPWTTNTALSSGNFTGGSGLAASTESDNFIGVPYDTELRSPVFDCTDAVSVTIEFRANYQDIAVGGDAFDVDVSIDGGGSWTNVLHWDEDHGAFYSTPGEDVSLDISGIAAGESNVIIRVHSYSLSPTPWDWYAQIDDASIILGYDGICVGQLCYAYCSSACLPSYCDVYLCGAPSTINVGQITYHFDLCMGPPPPSSCVVFIPIAP